MRPSHLEDQETPSLPNKLQLLEVLPPTPTSTRSSKGGYMALCRRHAGALTLRQCLCLTVISQEFGSCLETRLTFPERNTSFKGAIVRAPTSAIPSAWEFLPAAGIRIYFHAVPMYE